MIDGATTSTPFRVTWFLLLGMLVAVSLYAQTPEDISKALEGLSWRSIGPADMGGRTVDIVGIPGDPTLDNGLPTGVLGRIGLGTTPANTDVVYAIIESKDDGVLWRSENQGAT